MKRVSIYCVFHIPQIVRVLFFFLYFGMCRNSNVITVISLKIGDVIVKQFTCSEILPSYTKIIFQKRSWNVSIVCNIFLVLMCTIHRCCKIWLRLLPYTFNYMYRKLLWSPLETFVSCPFNTCILIYVTYIYIFSC